MPDHEEKSGFGTRHLPADPDTTAPDGSQVRVLLSLAAGSAAHFQLAPAAVSRAGRHRTVDEVWYILAGRGEMWRRDGAREEVVALKSDVCLTIPAGTSFQFRATGASPLSAFAVTMPPWPVESDDEWVEVEPYWPVQGRNRACTQSGISGASTRVVGPRPRHGSGSVSGGPRTS